MKLLDFQMPPFARIQYVSKEIKDEWEPAVRQARRAYEQLELLTVKYGLRHCTTRHISPYRIEEEMVKIARLGLVWVPIIKVGAYSGFAHGHPPVKEGQPWNYYGVVADTLENALRFIDASEAGDHETLGQLLGYPDCCREFFTDVWGAGYVDPIWQQAKRAFYGNVDEEKSSLDNHIIHLKDSVSHLTVSMLRYIGVRIVPHIPCSMDCQHSHDMALSWIGVGVAENVEGLDELVQLLTLPTEWDCLKGIAIVSTPLFKISTNSMTCYPNYVVRKDGTWYPENAPSGLKFPWETRAGFGCNTSIRTHVKSDLIQVDGI